ncbi:Alb1-domain-containing protein [Calycina marina]|uniref:Alb1-domain-containing protein n=1 Tax=Calycina marina TaxID=1763456 RepID=A0A9P7Z7U4_9HELO|nr:Alb1-domain-containing protein [Calycina marina]
MAKTAPMKKGKNPISVRSRASKRASSPSIDTDKSLKNVKPPNESVNYRPSVLAVHQSAGVSKKSKNGRKTLLSAKAKRRQEKGMDRAEAVMDKKEIRIVKSKDRSRTVQERSKAWEDLNKKMLAKKAQEDALALGLELGKESLVLDDGTKDMEEVDVDAMVSAVAGLKASASSSGKAELAAAHTTEEEEEEEEL